MGEEQAKTIRENRSELNDTEREWFLEESRKMQERIVDGFRRKELPDYMMAAVRYVMTGKPVGNFLQAVFSNDLMGATAHADSTNMMLLSAWTKWLYNDCPGYQKFIDPDNIGAMDDVEYVAPWGSKANFDRWREIGGWDGLLSRRIVQQREVSQT